MHDVTQQTPPSDRRPRRREAAVYRRRRLGAVLLAAVAVTGLVLVAGQTKVLLSDADGASADGGVRPTPSAAAPTSTATATASATETTAVTTTPTATATSSATSTAAGPETVLDRGTGRLVVVPGSVPAPGDGPVKKVRVEVEGGTGLDAAAFAAEVMSTLNDSRSWGNGGRMTFARTAGPADIRVILASPQTSEAMCRPLRTFGRLSCSIGDKAIITTYRWVNATPEFDDRALYRQYVVNHEVGHVLGHGHEQCPGAGQPAPVMQQQTKKVAPCTPNAWPFR